MGIDGLKGLKTGKGRTRVKADVAKVDTASLDQVQTLVEPAAASALVQPPPQEPLPSPKPLLEEWDVPGTHYNCFNCNAMCCSLYQRVAVNEEDIQRLSCHFGMSRRTFLRTYTHRSGADIILNRVPDELLEDTCVFLNQETRLCGVHQVRPEVCQVWPPAETQGRCVYYDVLQFERAFQNDPDLLIKVEIRLS